MTKDGVTMYNPLTNEPHDKRIDIAALDIARRGNESLGTTQHMYQVDGGSSFHHHQHQQQQQQHQQQQQMYAFAHQHMQQHPGAPQHAGGFFAHAFHQPQQNQHVKLPPPPPSNLVSVHGQHQYLQNQPFMNHHHQHQHQGMAMQPTIVFASPPPSSPSLSREMTAHSLQSNNRQDSGHLQSASGHHSGHLMVSGHHMVSTTGHVGNSDAAGSGHQLRSISGVSTADAEHGGSTNDPFAFRSGSGAVYQMPMQQQQQQQQEQVMNAQPQFMQASAHGSSNNSDYPQGSGSHNDGSGYILQTRDGLYMSNMPVGYAGMRFER